MPLTFLLGGARSGKSALAVRMATEWGGPVVFLATAEDRDAEMRERIERHRRDRPSGWTTVEESLDLTGTIAACASEAYLIVDCVSLWVANLLEAGWEAERIEEAARAAAEQATGRTAPTVVVSNEVGLGVVPTTPLGRSYRDVLGRANACFARAADRAYLVAAGRVVALGDPPA